MKKIGIGLILTVLAITCMACGNKDDSDDKEVNYIEISDSIHDYRSDYEYKLEEIQEYLDKESYETAIDELNLLKDVPEFQEFTDDIDLRISDIKKLMLNESIKTINDEYELDKIEEGIGQAVFDQIIRLDNLKEDYNEFTVDIENNIEHAIKNNYTIIMESADKAINENLKGNLESTDYFIDSAIPLLEDAIEQVNISGKYNKYTKLIKDRADYLYNHRQECAEIQYIDKPNFDCSFAYHPKYNSSAIREYTSKEGSTYLDFWAMVIQQSNKDGTKPYVIYDFNNKHDDLELVFFCGKDINDNKRFYLEVYADDELVATSEEIGSNSGHVFLNAKINKCDKVKIVAIRTDHTLSLDKVQPSVGIVSIVGYNENKPELVPYTPCELDDEAQETSSNNQDIVE